MLNKTDKYVLISLITLIVALVVPMTLLVISSYIDFELGFEIPIINEILFIFCAMNYIFIVPILVITQIISFLIKLFSKNKNKKDWIIILLSFITILFFGFIYLVLFLIGSTL